MEVRILQPADATLLATAGPDVFDDAPVPLAIDEFLRDPRHHIAVAIEDGVVVGFASAVHYVHPDKPAPELWINEVGVAVSHRGRGLGKAILRSLLDHARQLGCVEAWVVTERDNREAMGLYASIGGIESPSVMFTFRIGEGS